MAEVPIFSASINVRMDFENGEREEEDNEKKVWVGSG